MYHLCPVIGIDVIPDVCAHQCIYLKSMQGFKRRLQKPSDQSNDLGFLITRHCAGGTILKCKCWHCLWTLGKITECSLSLQSFKNHDTVWTKKKGATFLKKPLKYLLFLTDLEKKPHFQYHLFILSASVLSVWIVPFPTGTAK